ncbi:MAG: hypothetical protein Q8K55_08445 [Gemmatimonadaceae bacterium]|nr:hypothetical protein [Gemmatimonadaceae bacterium]
MKRTVLAAAGLLGVMACDQLVTTPLRYGTVEVRTTRRDGTPVASVPLVLFTGLRVMGYDTTDASGAATFIRVPEGIAYGVYAGIPEGYERPERLLGGSLSDFVPFNVRRDSLPTVTFQFLRIGPGTVTAQVVKQGEGPAAGAEVELYAANGVVSRQQTNADGSVSFDEVPFGVYGIRTPRPPEYRDIDESPLVSLDGLLIEDGATTGGTLTLQPCRETILLRVTDPVRGGAAAIRTELFQATGNLDAKRTASDGTVRYERLTCGAYGVRIRPSADWVVTPGRGTEFVDGLVLRRGATLNAALPVLYNSCRGSVRVTVVDGTGASVLGASLLMYTEHDDPTITQVAANGTTVFENLGCGARRGVRITPPVGWTVQEGVGSSYIEGFAATSSGTVDVRFTLVARAQ